MSGRVTRDHHNMRRTVSLNGNKISNDGGNEGISVADNGNVTVSGELDIDGAKITSAGALEIDPGGQLSVTGQDMSVDSTKKIIFGDAGEHVVGDGTNLEIISSGDAIIKSTASDTRVVIGESDDGSSRFEIELHAQGVGTMLAVEGASSGTSNLYMYEGGGVTNNDYLRISVGAHGATTISTVDASAAAAHLTLDPDGDLIISGADTKIDATKKLYLDGGGDSYIHESSADVLQVYTGGDKIVEITEATTGNKVDFGTTGVGFTQFEPTYNASDTNVTFNDNGNKAFATFGAGNITDMNLYFPDTSCNCVLLLKQDGTGSRTVTNWKTFDQADGNESTVIWAGGSAPTLTTTANKIDIISLYWDNDNHKAYGVASLNF